MDVRNFEVGSCGLPPMSPAGADAMRRAHSSVVGKERTWMDGSPVLYHPRSPAARDRGHPPIKGSYGPYFNANPSVPVEHYINIYQ